ncbi:MAG: phosphotransferase [Actinomycetes bacterium]
MPRATDANWTPLAGLGRGSWLVRRAEGPELVVRQASEAEEQAARAAADVAVGPVVVAGAECWIATEYLPGGHVTPLELSRPDRLDELAGLLRRLHSCDLLLPLSTLADSRDAYVSAIGAEQLPDGLRGAAREADRIEESLDSESSLCVPAHLDVVANLLATPVGLRLIDFEYAAGADPARELGQVIWEAELAREGAQRLVGAYGTDVGVTEGRAVAWAWVTGVTWTAWALTFDDNLVMIRYGRRSWERLRDYWGRPSV